MVLLPGPPILFSEPFCLLTYTVDTDAESGSSKKKDAESGSSGKKKENKIKFYVRIHWFNMFNFTIGFVLLHEIKVV